VVECRLLTKRFGDVRAADEVDLTVHAGEILALLGPSGCGKTTTLRLVAGFERPDAGTIALDGRIVAGEGTFVPAERRRTGVVFQEHALFPHLDTAHNVGYGVRDRAGRAARVEAMLELVGLAGLGRRMPHELSGGQQQRVALARALAPRPSIVLLDEPFSDLDAALRTRVRDEVRGILRDAGATAVVVTHDQEEALSFADRVAVMREGRVLQVDSPFDVYASPAELFVATFVGDAVVLEGVVNGSGRAHTALGELTLSTARPSGPCRVVIRPEWVRLVADPTGRGVVREVAYFGHDQIVTVALDDGSPLRARLGAARRFVPGDAVAVEIVDDVLAFPSPAERTGPAIPAPHASLADR
jgi:iron(III) transport system ATP-binding protein